MVEIKQERRRENLDIEIRKMGLQRRKRTRGGKKEIEQGRKKKKQ